MSRPTSDIGAFGARNFRLWRAIGDVEVDQSLRPTEIRRKLGYPFARKSGALMQMFPLSLQNQYELLLAECVSLTASEPFV
jgi:hypothetical protein